MMSHTKVLTLPRGWKWAKLKDVLVGLESGSRPRGGVNSVLQGVPSLSAEHMTKFGTFNFSNLKYIPEDFYATMQRGHVCLNDILVVKDGATTGKVAFIHEGFLFKRAVVNEHVFICRPDIDVIWPRFLFYWLWSPMGYAAIRASYQGAAIGGINQGFTHNIYCERLRD
jgi:type I restriction enzyme, S subunit